MIEKTVLDYLGTHLLIGTTPVPVYMQEPENSRPETKKTFVVVEKTGSGRENRIYTATIAIQSYAPTLYEAASLNELVKTAMDGITSLDGVSDSQLNSDYAFIKTSTKQPRYQAVFDLTHY